MKIKTPLRSKLKLLFLFMLCSNLFGTEPHDAITFFDRGRLFVVQGEYDKAIADFTEAIRMDPNYSEAYISG